MGRIFSPEEASIMVARRGVDRTFDLGTATRRLPTVVGLLLLWFTWVSPAPAQPLPLPADLQQRVNKAIEDGANALKAAQNAFGTWTLDKNDHPVGYAALGGLTLLECGVPADDPVVKRAAQFVRKGCVACDKTYELALSILFLDRLGDRKDRYTIEVLAARLIAGQTPTGGWTYKCPVLTTVQHKSLMAALRAKKLTPARLRADVRGLPVLQDPAKLVPVEPPDKRHVAIWGTTDNSNTQFAMLAIWAARRQGLPVERTLKLIVNRFETHQNPDGSWAYDYRLGGGMPERPPMTCVGLLGLAIGHGMARDDTANQPVEALALGIVGFPGPAPVLLAVERINKQLAAREAVKQGQQDQRVLGGFVALNKHIGMPAGRMENLPQVSIYFLWSVERVGVLYNLARVGEKDWYRWGAEILVANQQPAGHWQGGGYPGSTPASDTCLALLFLKRANLASDLTARLPFNPANLAKGINDKLPTSSDKKEPSPPAPSLETPVSTPPPVAVQPVVASPPAPRPPVAVSTPSDDPPVQASSGNLLLIVLLALFGVLLIGGGVLVFVLTRSRDDEDDAPHRSKKKIARPQAHADPAKGPPSSGRIRSGDKRR
jgi:hypothetical protein